MTLSDQAVPSGIYRHYKGALYFVFNTLTHSETRELLVCYRCLYGDYSWWVRPLSMFKERVLIDEKMVKRFEFLSAVSLSDQPHFFNDNQTELLKIIAQVAERE